MEYYNINLSSAGEKTSPARRINALGGEFNCRWNNTVPISTSAHNALMSAFFKAGGIFDRLVETCPLKLTSPNAPTNRETLGTIIVGMLNGAKHYRHLDTMSGDRVTAAVFGFRKLMSCDSVRRNLDAIPQEKGLEWIWEANLQLLSPILDQDYIIDLDPTVKSLYGHQEGAKLGYNPHKPGRPSHCLHTLCIAKPRIVLGLVIHSGNETAGSYSMDMLDKFLKWLSGRLRPKLVRGDVGFGNETIIACCESNHVQYLFKLQRNRHLKSIFQRFLENASIWQDAGDGWQCTDTCIRLNSWSKQRRILFMRRPIEQKPSRKKDPPRREFQTILPGIELVTINDETYADGYEWYALVTDLNSNPQVVSKLYRERGDCENIFDEMKNQWGWGGFVTHDMKRTAIAAGLSAFVANCWNIFCRLGGDGSHQEAITTRRKLQSCVARIASHGRHKSITIFTSGKSFARHIFCEISNVLEQISNASQLKVEERWLALIYYAFRKYQLKHLLYPPLMNDQIMLPLS